ncbi:MAG TPA: DUF6361 family protein [Wenzhouxiangellaceae bacterium]|nr:DUF6361 family protein [Wenzhouxiangellaceae bacterium]
MAIGFERFQGARSCFFAFTLGREKPEFTLRPRNGGNLSRRFTRRVILAMAKRVASRGKLERAPLAAASFTWLDLTADDRDKVRRVLDLFNEQGTVDELGLGSLRDTISNALFPGTSVLHTRLRYVLFIPWIYQELESWGTGYDVDRHAREMEIQLIYALAESDDTAGVIGIDAGESLSRLASNAYWALLVHWGLFVPARPQSWYHRNFDELLARRSNVARADDPGVTWTQQPTWHPRLPEATGDFPASADFALTNKEADFLLGRRKTNADTHKLEGQARFPKRLAGIGNCCSTLPLALFRQESRDARISGTPNLALRPSG